MTEVEGRRVGVRWKPPALVYVYALGETLRRARIPVRNLKDEEIVDKIYNKHEFGLLRGLERRYVERMVTILRHHHGIEIDQDNKSDLTSSERQKSEAIMSKQSDVSDSLKQSDSHVSSVKSINSVKQSDSHVSSIKSNGSVKKSDSHVSSIKSINSVQKSDSHVSSVKSNNSAKQSDSRVSSIKSGKSFKQSESQINSNIKSTNSTKKSDSQISNLKSVVDNSGIVPKKNSMKGLLDFSDISRDDSRKGRSSDILKLLDEAGKNFDDTEPNIIGNKTNIKIDKNQRKYSPSFENKIPDVMIKRNESGHVNVKIVDLKRNGNKEEKLKMTNPEGNSSLKKLPLDQVERRVEDGSEDTDLDIEDVDIPLDPEEPRKSSDSEILEEEDFWS